MPTVPLLVVTTAQHRYAVRRDDVSELRLIDAEASGGGMQSWVKVDLGALLYPGDTSTQRRRHAMFVPLRRKQIVLMVDRIDMVEGTQPLPLPMLLQARLLQPWSVGVLQIEDQVVVQIDIRAVARSVLLTPTLLA